MSVIERPGSAVPPRATADPAFPVPEVAAPSFRRAIMLLSTLVVVIAMVVAIVGIFWNDGGISYSIPTYRGQIAEMYGSGLYADDTLFAAGNNKASDLVTLFLGIPVLVSTVALYRKGSVRARLALLGTLGYFVYIGASYSFGTVAYNELFILYVTMFSAALFGFVLTFLSFDAVTVDRHLTTQPPRRWIGVFMLVSAIVTFAVWIVEPIASLTEGTLPKRLDVYTTLFTHAFDIAIIVPAAAVAGVMILRRRPHGYIIAFSLLILEAMLAPLIATATVAQIRLGIDFTAGEVIGPISGFSMIALVALWAIRTMLRDIMTVSPEAIDP